MAAMAVGLNAGLSLMGYGWLYFDLMGGIALILGVAGSAFSTFSGLYLGKDNDQLLSLPIPVKYIIGSRIMSVLLMDAMYSLPVLLPTYIVYIIMNGPTFANVICGLLFVLTVMMVVFSLSCLLGWVIAKVSTKIKNKSFVTVFLALLLIGGYYFIYFKAQVWIRDLVANVETYGEKIKGGAYFLYLFGSFGEGNWLSAAIFFGGALILLILTWLILKNTFISIATASGTEKKAVYKSKVIKGRSVFGALLAKEFKRFTSDANYMLNCGLGIIVIVIGAVALIFVGRPLFEIIGALFGESSRDTGAVPLCAVMFFLATMINTAAPGVSLEGKAIWIPRSLPVKSNQVLRAKGMMQFLLTAIPLLLLAVCGILTMNARIRTKILILVFAVVCSFFLSMFDLLFGTKMANVNWTNPLIPIKQSGAVVIAIFATWGIGAVFAAPFFVIPGLEAWMYLALWCLIFLAVGLFMFRWIDTKGAKHFEEL